jgi:hypothetical protein
MAQVIHTRFDARCCACHYPATRIVAAAGIIKRLQNSVRGAIYDQLNNDSRTGFHGAECELRSSAAKTIAVPHASRDGYVISTEVDVILNRPLCRKKGSVIMRPCIFSIQFRSGFPRTCF